MAKDFTGADPDTLSESAAALWQVVLKVEGAEKPLSQGANKVAHAAEVPELAIALKRLGAALSSMTHAVGQQTRAANTMAFDVSQDIRTAGGH